MFMFYIVYFSVWLLYIMLRYVRLRYVTSCHVM